MIINLGRVIVILSSTSLLLFFAFCMFLDWHEHRVKEIRLQEGRALERIENINAEKERQRRRADSLQTIVNAYSNPEILWTARAAYSETRKPHEMFYVSWVVRNRVEASFLGENGYKNVVLHPKQFSAFNEYSPHRDFYVNLEPSAAEHRPRWYQAMKVAENVVGNERASHRPFSEDTFYFYSEVSMRGEKHPDWLPFVSRVNLECVGTMTCVEPERFRYFRPVKMASNQRIVGGETNDS